MSYIIKAKEIYLENEIITDSCVSIEDNTIKSLHNPGTSDALIDLSDFKLFPGFLDIHVHGGNGHDTMDSSYEALNEISKFKLKEGVTSFCPTTVTTSLEKTKTAITAIASAMDQGCDGAKIIGTFLEGPYINPAYKGAHPEPYIRPVSLEEIADLISTGKGTVKSFAIAPELPFALEAIAYLKSRQVNVRIGHSGATCAQVDDAIQKGAGIAIHTYNAMSPFNHREPGMLGAILTNDEIYNEIICDFIHVNPVAVEVLLRAKGVGQVILITDCMMAGGLQDGEYLLGELPVTVHNSIARTAEGALAGSTLSIIAAVKNLVDILHISVLDAVKMASLTPATALGIQNLAGSIKVGKRADFVAVDDDLNVRYVMVDGVTKLDAR